MVKRFIKNILQNFCIYLLTLANIIHAISNNSVDWLLWLSIILCGLSVALCAMTAYRSGTDD